MDSINKFMKVERINKDLVGRTRAFFKNAKRAIRTAYHQRSINLASPELRGELVLGARAALERRAALLERLLDLDPSDLLLS